MKLCMHKVRGKYCWPTFPGLHAQHSGVAAKPCEKGWEYISFSRTSWSFLPVVIYLLMGIKSIPAGCAQIPQQQGWYKHLDRFDTGNVLKCRLLVALCMSLSLFLISAEKQIEFCCHLARGSLDPNEPLMYEYVKFVVDFKYFTHGKLLLQPTFTSLPLSFKLCVNL